MFKRSSTEKYMKCPPLSVESSIGCSRSYLLILLFYSSYEHVLEATVWTWNSKSLPPASSWGVLSRKHVCLQALAALEGMIYVMQTPILHDFFSFTVDVFFHFQKRRKSKPQTKPLLGSFTVMYSELYI